MFSPGFWDASSSLFLGVALTHISTCTFNSADVLQKEEQLCPVVLVGLQLVEAGQIPIVACMLGRIPYGFLHLLGTYRRSCPWKLVHCQFVTWSGILLPVDVFLTWIWNCSVGVGSFSVSAAQELKI